MANRFRRMLLKNAFLCIYLNYKAKKIAKQNVLDDDTRYKLAIRFVKKYHRDMRVIIKSYGLENIDSSLEGCLIVGNHQGRDDAPVVFETLENFTTSFVIDDKRSHQFVFGNVCDMMRGKRIQFDDLVSQLEMYNEMAEEIQQGRRFLIFPEAGYTDNKNNLQEFNTPCFIPAIKAKCPILPVCLYDTYRVFEDKKSKFVEVECHILKPIVYEEFKNISKQALAKLVYDRINEKLEEIKKRKEEN